MNYFYPSAFANESHTKENQKHIYREWKEFKKKKLLVIVENNQHGLV